MVVAGLRLGSGSGSGCDSNGNGKSAFSGAFSASFSATRVRRARSPSARAASRRSAPASPVHRNDSAWNLVSTPPQSRRSAVDSNVPSPVLEGSTLSKNGGSYSGGVEST